MPRPERPLDPAAGPVQAFAADLRKLRQDAGNPKYLQMQRLTGRSRTALAEAGGGDHLPTWETVGAYVRACGGDLAEWEQRWTHLRDTLRTQREATAPQDITPPGQTQRPRSTRPLAILTATMAVVAAAAVIAAVTISLSSNPAPAGRMNSQQGRAIITIQNKVATGPTALTEDSTPIYLSTQPEPFCAKNGCEVRGTSMWSGVLQAICIVHGAPMTNENLLSPGISRNKGGITSSLWYRAELPNGPTGYISEVYLTPASRGGLGLPTCTP
jgi:hypothetical protein